VHQNAMRNLERKSLLPEKVGVGVLPNINTIQVHRTFVKTMVAMVALTWFVFSFSFLFSFYLFFILFLLATLTWF